MYFRKEFAFLSNFYSSDITYNGEPFPTAEHAYQASKAVSKNDFQLIQSATSPAQAKKLARSISVRPNWNAIKRRVMREILEEKFAIPHLREKLLQVQEPIIEHNKHGDTYWGVCGGVGENHLGKILTRIRNEIIVFS